MFRLHIPIRRAQFFLGLAALGSSLCALAQQATPTAAALPARAGTPSFLGAVDTTYQVWSAWLQKFGPLPVFLIAALMAYIIGFALFNAMFYSGTFAPKAAHSGACWGAVILLIFTVLMLPVTWPWWAPYAFFALGLFILLALVSTMSKKAV